MSRKPKRSPAFEGGHWLLPSISRTMGLLGLPNDVRGWVEWVHREFGGTDRGGKLPADTKTLLRGVKMSPKAGRRVLRYVLKGLRAPAPGSQLKLRALRSALPPTCKMPNTHYWRGCISGFRLSEASGFPGRTLSYIKHLCALEDDLMTKVTGLPAQPAAAVESLSKGFEAHSLIPGHVLESAIDQLVDMAPAHGADAGAENRLTPELVSLLLWMWWDPILRLTAVAETEWLSENPVAPWDCDQEGTHRGLMAKLWPAWDGKRLVRSPERLFENIRENISVLQGQACPLSWHSLARKIPDPGWAPGLDESRVTRKDDTKYQQLRHWMKGRQPEQGRFEEFMRRLGALEEDLDLIRLIMPLIYNLDDEIDGMIKETKDWPIEVERVLVEIFKDYPRYLEAARTPGGALGAPGV